MFVLVAVLATSAATPTSVAVATSIEPVDVAELIDAPASAVVETISEPDGTTTVVVTEKSEDSLPAEAASLRRGESLVVHEGDSVTVYEAVSATCTQTTSMDSTVPVVHMTSSGQRYLPGTWSLTRGSGCTSSYTWSAEFWGTDPFWGTLSLAKKRSTTTPPGSTTTIYSSVNCTGTSPIYWRYYMRNGAGGVLGQTPSATRSCGR